MSPASILGPDGFIARRLGANLLPDYKVVIFDEAHTLEDVAAEHLGLRFGRGSLDWLLNKLLHPRTRRGLLAFIPSEAAQQQLQATRQAGEQFFGSLLAWVDRQPRSARGPPRPASESFRAREPGAVPDVLSEE